MREEDAVFRGAESKDRLSKLHNSHKEGEFEDIKQVQDACALSTIG